MTPQLPNSEQNVRSSDRPAATPAEAAMGAIADLLQGVPRFLRGAVGVVIAIFVVLVVFRLIVLGFAFHSAKGLIGETGISEGAVRSLTWLLGIASYLLWVPVLWFLVTGFRVTKALMALAAWVVIQLAIPAAGDYVTRPRHIQPGEIDRTVLFDRKGGKVWYASGEPCPELFDAPGYHPQTGEALRPITPGMARSIKKCLRAEKLMLEKKAAAAPGAPQATVRRFEYPYFTAEFVETARSGNRLIVTVRFTNKSDREVILSSSGNSECDEIQLADRAGNVLACEQADLGQVQAGRGLRLLPRSSALATFAFQASANAEPVGTGTYRITLPVVVSVFARAAYQGEWGTYQQTVPTPESSYRLHAEL